MGLFFNYAKPGPGVDKDAPKKKGIFLYFELYFRKFWKLIQANLLYFVCSLPMYLIYFLFFWMYLMPSVAGALQEVGTELSSEEMNLFVVMFGVAFSTFMTIVWGSGPASAAYAYVMRCYAREEHAWLISDSKDRYWENFKQAMVVSLVDIAVLFLSSTAIRFYFAMYRANQSTIYLILCSLVCIVLMLYTFTHYYVYQLMVTFENKIGQLYRNAFIMAMGFFPMNLLLTIIPAWATLMLFTLLNPVFSVILTAVLWISAFRFPIDFYSARLIRRRLIPQQTAEAEELGE